jgi:hypothetical protein
VPLTIIGRKLEHAIKRILDLPSKESSLLRARKIDITTILWYFKKPYYRTRSTKDAYQPFLSEVSCRQSNLHIVFENMG